LPDDQSLDNYPRSSQDDMYGNFIGITNVCSPSSNPIGTILCSFDDGSAKVWSVATRADVLMKALEVDQIEKNKSYVAGEVDRHARYDISLIGY
jgi:hypothetical protein